MNCFNCRQLERAKGADRLGPKGEGYVIRAVRFHPAQPAIPPADWQIPSHLILNQRNTVSPYSSSAEKGHDNQKGYDKMMEDQVLTEIRKIKDDLASKYDYNVRKMLDDAIRRQRNSKYRVVNLITKKRADLSLQRTAAGS